VWRKAKVVALPKPGKDYKNPKNYRPIFLLCHTFKLYERMIMNRIKSQIERKLIPEQAGFKPGKNCTGTKPMPTHRGRIREQKSNWGGFCRPICSI